MECIVRSRGSRALAVAVIGALCGCGAIAKALPSASLATGEIVLFPFDDCSLPFNKGLNLTLVAGRKHPRQDPEHPGKPVLQVGQPGDPDYPRLSFYGTVLAVDGEYRMWYTGSDGSDRRVCYAVSKDGIRWEKPKLGLVEYHGNRANNLVAFGGDQAMRGLCALVLYEPEDPDPQRRYKMLREIAIPGVSWPVHAAVSADGIHWKPVGGDRPINPGHQLEPSGLIRFGGAYFVNGHSNAIRHPVPGAQKRTMQTFASPDFEHWTTAAVMSFRRDNLPPRPILDFEGHRGEQVHVGASLWSRGNVILGFYGQYHNPTNDRRTSTIDLGLVVSNNAINFREPVPDFKIIPALEEADRAEARLTQGQGFQNIGDRTIVYYGISVMGNQGVPTGVRIATWPRDRLGFYAPAPDITDAHCISAPFTPPRPDARVYINASGLGADTRLAVELLDDQFRPLAGYAAADCLAFPAEDGFRLPVTWRDRKDLATVSGRFRVRVNFTGRDSGKARLYAVYIE